MAHPNDDDPSGGQFHGSLNLRLPIESGIVVRSQPSVDALPSKAMHSHAYPYFWMLISGDCSERIEGRSERVYRPMELTFHPAGERHSHHQGERAPVGLGIILPNAVTRYAEEFAPINDEPEMLRGPDQSRIAHALVAECGRIDRSSELVLEGLCLQLIGSISRLRFMREIAGPPGWLMLARDLVRDTYSDSIKVSDIAKTVGVHPVHLSSSFKKHFRQSIGEYVRSVRTDAALRMLANTALSSAEIAAACGFYDESHLSRTLRTSTGFSPQEYRNRLKG